MSVQFNTAVSLAQQYNLLPPPNPQTNPAGYNQWLQGTAAPFVAEPSYHPQLPSLFAANNGQSLVAADSFAGQVQGRNPQPTIDMDLALLSQDAYNTGAADPIGAAGWTRVEGDDLPPGISTPLSSDASGFQSAIYTDGDGNYVLAFAGTDPTSIPDWLNNGQQALGFDSAQYRDAMALAQEAAAEWGDDLVITGHSLGGGLASAAALTTDNPAVTFNAAGLSDETLRNLGYTPNGAREVAADGLVRRYNVENDILTGAQQGTPLPDAVGHELRLDNTYLIKDPIRAHMMDAVIRGLDHGNVTHVETSALDSALERPGEALLDLGGNVVREGAGLLGDAGGVVGELGGDLVDAGRSIAEGRPIEGVVGLTGDVAEAGLQLAGDVVDRGLNVVDDALQSGGNLLGGWIRDAGQALGIEGVGNTVGGWVEQGAQWLGNGADTVGDWVENGLDAAGGWVSETFGGFGSWASDRVSDAANWTGDRISDAASWTGDRLNDISESRFNPLNWGR